MLLLCLLLLLFYCYYVVIIILIVIIVKQCARRVGRMQMGRAIIGCTDTVATLQGTNPPPLVRLDVLRPAMDAGRLVRDPKRKHRSGVSEL